MSSGIKLTDMTHVLNYLQSQYEKFDELKKEDREYVLEQNKRSLESRPDDLFSCRPLRTLYIYLVFYDQMIAAANLRPSANKEKLERHTKIRKKINKRIHQKEYDLKEHVVADEEVSEIASACSSDTMLLFQSISDRWLSCADSDDLELLQKYFTDYDKDPKKIEVLLRGCVRIGTSKTEPTMDSFENIFCVIECLMAHKSLREGGGGFNDAS